MEEVESYESLRYTINWGGYKLLVPQVTWPRKNIHFVESVCRVVCVCKVQDTALSRSSYFITLRTRLLQGFRSVCVSPCFSKVSSSLSTEASFISRCYMLCI